MVLARDLGIFSIVIALAFIIAWPAMMPGQRLTLKNSSPYDGHSTTDARSKVDVSVNDRASRDVAVISPLTAPITDRVTRSFIVPMAGLSVRDRIQFRVGESFFSDPWVIAPSSTTLRDGLGPYFSARSCQSCHVKGGRSDTLSESGKAKNIQVRLARRDKTNSQGSEVDPVYGRHLQPFSVPALALSRQDIKEGHRLSRGEGWISVEYQAITGHYNDGELYELRRPQYQLHGLAYGGLHDQTAISFRVAPSLAGLGLLEAIPDQALINAADQYDLDGDGISGKLNLVVDEQSDNYIMRPDGARHSLGRFGHKARHATITSQTAAAFRDDIGITNSLFQDESCTATQIQCQNITSGINNGSTLEIEDTLLAQVVDFVKLLAPPRYKSTLNDNQRQGKKLFQRAQCADCHTPSHITTSDVPEGRTASIGLLSAKTIWPYSDLLLHDMGDALADDHIEYDAQGTEWRTAPLWGLSTAMQLNGDSGLLHDGRARNVSEAILWHGGEAEASKQVFLAMNKQQRSMLIQFVESL